MKKTASVVVFSWEDFDRVVEVFLAKVPRPERDLGNEETTQISGRPTATVGHG